MTKLGFLTNLSLCVLSFYAKISCAVTLSGSTCNPRLNSLPIASSTNSNQYLRCERTSGPNAKYVWIAHECPANGVFNDTLRDCRPIRILSQLTLTNGISAESKQIQGRSLESRDSKLNPVQDFPRTELSNVAYEPCFVSQPVAVNKDCCTKDALQPDPADPTNYHYFQCSPIEGKHGWGKWVKMRCPSGYPFKAEDQVCGSITDEIRGVNLGPKSKQFIGPTYPACPMGSSANSLCAASRGSACPMGFSCYQGGCCQQQQMPNVISSSPCAGATGNPCSGMMTMPQNRMCADGSMALPISCQFDMQCSAGYYCATSIGACCRQVLKNCPDNTPSLPLPCQTDNQCAVGYYCPSSVGACCRRPFGSCPDMSQPLNLPCAGDNQCPQGYYCPAALGACCLRSSSAASSKCSDASDPLNLPCVSDLQCPASHSCQQSIGLCCQKPEPKCNDGSTPLDLSCVSDLQCPPSTHTCQSNIGRCCQRASSAISNCPTGSTINLPCLSDAQCPPTHFCPPSSQPDTVRLCCSRTTQVLHGAGIRLCVDGSSPLSFPNSCRVDVDCPLSYYCPVSVGACCLASSQQTHRSMLTAVCPDRSAPLPISCSSDSACPIGYNCPQHIRSCCRQSSVSLGSISSESSRCQDGSDSVGPCINGLCGLGYTCQSGSNVCCPTVSQNPLSCANGEQPVGHCLKEGNCGAGLSCVKGKNICCRMEAERCSDGAAPVARCIDGQCGAGFVCQQGVLCCKASFHAANSYLQISSGSNSNNDDVLCSDMRPSIGSCVSGLCGVGYQCVPGKNICCPSTNGHSSAAHKRDTCPVGPSSPTPCFNGICTDNKFTCMSGFCCQKSPFDPTKPNEMCPNGNPSAGSCSDNFACNNPGYICIGTQCCAADNSFTEQQGQGSHPSNHGCPGQGRSVGPCIEGLCGAGFNCIGQECCPDPELKDVFRHPASESLERFPPGSHCRHSRQCNGFRTGLAKCNETRCICLSPSQPRDGTCAVDSIAHYKVLRPGDYGCRNDSQCRSGCSVSICRHQTGRCECEHRLLLYRNTCVKTCPWPLTASERNGSRECVEQSQLSQRNNQASKSLSNSADTIPLC